VHRSDGSSVEALRVAVRDAIEAYEPRLRHVRVRRRERDETVLRLVFVVRATLITGDPVRLETTFESQSEARVRPVSVRG
jgi:predicted component of type VI protein secretion system